MQHKIVGISVRAHISPTLCPNFNETKRMNYYFDAAFDLPSPNTVAFRLRFSRDNRYFERRTGRRKSVMSQKRHYLRSPRRRKYLFGA